MKAINKLRKRRAVSPVIATVIIVAVTITVAVAVAYWMSGIASQYTAFEKVEIQSAICTYEPIANPTHWKIVISLKNSGTKTATLTDVFINDVGAAYATDYTANAIKANLGPLNTKLIESGATDTVTVWIPDDASNTLSSGTTINIKIHSAAGMDYIKLIQLT